MLNNQNELEQFILRENAATEEIDWVIRDNRLWFVSRNVDKHSIPSHEMIFRAIDYAKELEKII